MNDIKCMETLKRLANAADAFAADQTGATHPQCGLVQPVTVKECEELNQAIAEAYKLIANRS